MAIPVVLLQPTKPLASCRQSPLLTQLSVFSHQFTTFFMKPSIISADTLAITGKIDKTEHIRSFVESQRRNLAHYAAEGRSAKQTWEEGKNREEGNTPTPSAFNSPVLRPRVPQTDRQDIKVPESEHTKKAQSNSMESNTIEVDTLRTNPCQKRKCSTHDHEKILSKQTTLDPYIKQRRKRVASSDSEREARLAERRERRRSRREIVKPPNPIGKTEGDEENEDSAKNRGKEKKGRGGNFAAGLALMHGFTAANLGTSRLTLKPSSGLFHKGKASTRNAVRAKENQKRRGLTWSEEQFLSKSGNNTRQRSESPATASEDDGSEESQTTSSLSRPINQQPTQNKPRKRRSVKEMIDLVVESDEDESQKTSRVPSPESNVKEVESVSARNKTTRNPSIIWDIERDSNVTHKASALSRSIILDTTRSKWATCNTSSEDPVTQFVEKETLASTRHGTSPTKSSSLAPSQSASQINGDQILPDFDDEERLVNPEPDNNDDPTGSIDVEISHPPSLISPTHDDLLQDTMAKAIDHSYVEPRIQGVGLDDASSHSLLASIEEELKSSAGLDSAAHLWFDAIERSEHQQDDGREETPEVMFGMGGVHDSSLNNWTRDETYYASRENEYVPLPHSDVYTALGPLQFDEDDLYERQGHSNQGDPLWGNSPTIPGDVFGQDTMVEVCDIDWDADAGYECNGRVASPSDIHQEDQDDIMEGTLSEGDTSDTQQFSQGRALLLGLGEPQCSRYQTVSKAEEDVAKSLRGHWTPQRF